MTSWWHLCHLKKFNLIFLRKVFLCCCCCCCRHQSWFPKYLLSTDLTAPIASSMSEKSSRGSTTIVRLEMRLESAHCAPGKKNGKWKKSAPRPPQWKKRKTWNIPCLIARLECLWMCRLFSTLVCDLYLLSKTWSGRGPIITFRPKKLCPPTKKIVLKNVFTWQPRSYVQAFRPLRVRSLRWS